jgi:hypothetical protein
LICLEKSGWLRSLGMKERERERKRERERERERERDILAI